jgi:hypothetical protein
LNAQLITVASASERVPFSFISESALFILIKEINSLIKNYTSVQKIFNKAVDTPDTPPYKPAPDGANVRNETNASASAI